MNKKIYKTPVVTNVFLIPERLREIDNGYFVLRNHQTKQFEIHHSGQPHDTYCLTVPYDELDERTLHLVQKTRICNAEKLLLEMEEHNRKISDTQNAIPEEATVKLKETITYLGRHSDKGTLDDGAFTTRFL